MRCKSAYKRPTFETVNMFPGTRNVQCMGMGLLEGFSRKYVLQRIQLSLQRVPYGMIDAYLVLHAQPAALMLAGMTILAGWQHEHELLSPSLGPIPWIHHRSGEIFLSGLLRHSRSVEYILGSPSHLSLGGRYLAIVREETFSLFHTHAGHYFVSHPPVPVEEHTHLPPNGRPTSLPPSG